VVLKRPHVEKLGSVGEKRAISKRGVQQILSGKRFPHKQKEHFTAANSNALVGER